MKSDTPDSRSYAARLCTADAAVQAVRITEGAQAFGEAADACFDRSLHFDGLASPVAESPRTYLSPWHGSRTVHRLGSPRGRTVARQGERVNSESAPSTARPIPSSRVLVITRKNANFLAEIREHLADQPQVEQRFLDLADFPRLNRFAGDLARTAEQILGDRTELRTVLERRVRPHLDWADVVFVEWCLQQAVFLTLLDPGEKHVVVRLHSQEIFTPWPHLVDFSRVDDVVFVSEHLRDLALDVIPALSGANAPTLHVIPNALRLERFRRPKLEDARFRLVLIGWGHVAKDPLWALQVLERLRAVDGRYTLHLLGSEFRRDFSRAAEAYGDRLMPKLERLERQGAVHRHGHTSDVPGALEQLGVVLSSSVRESFHASVVEGAASGAVPVVRNWPFFAGRPHGAGTLFPTEWVVETPEEAARRILETTTDLDAWRGAGADASQHALRHWDWDVVKHRFDELLTPDRRG